MSYYYGPTYHQEELEFERFPSGVYLSRPNLGAEQLAEETQLLKFRSLQQDDDTLCLPLLEVSAEVNVSCTVAQTLLIQKFYNSSPRPIEGARYCFPLYDGAAVVSFRCLIGDDRVIVGQIKPKTEAKAEFQKAVAEHRVAALLEEHTPEVFEVQLGNMPGKTKVTVEIVYVNELKADLGGEGLLVTLPTSIAPRYGTPPWDYSASSVDASRNGLKITVNIAAGVRIRKVESRTHIISVEMGVQVGSIRTGSLNDLASAPSPDEAHPDLTKARVILSDRLATLDKDFVILILASGSSLLASRALFECPSDATGVSAMMVSLFPRNLFSSYVSTEHFAGEIIFVADCSGSMEGSKMNCLRDATQIFLESLPKQCSFNIYSFGSSFSSLWLKSRPYSQETLDTAVQHVRASFRADMGGTEILPAIKNAVEKRIVGEGSTTQIVLITDGEVWDINSLTKFVKETQTRSEGNVRFFALGIGDTVSHRLIEGIGREGGGFSEVVAADGQGRWEERVIRMLEGALMPSSWDCELELPGIPLNLSAEQPRLIQAPYQVPPLHTFSRRSVYFLLDKASMDDLSHITVKATSGSGECITETIPIEKTVMNMSTIHHLAAKAAMLDLECGGSWLHARLSSNQRPKSTMDTAIRTEAERLGNMYHVTGKWTTFIAVDRASSSETATALLKAKQADLLDLTRPRHRPIGSRYLLNSQSYSSNTSPNFFSAMDTVSHTLSPTVAYGPSSAPPPSPPIAIGRAGRQPRLSHPIPNQQRTPSRISSSASNIFGARAPPLRQANSSSQQAHYPRNLHNGAPTDSPTNMDLSPLVDEASNGRGLPASEPEFAGEPVTQGRPKPPKIKEPTLPRTNTRPSGGDAQPQNSAHELSSEKFSASLESQPGLHRPHSTELPLSYAPSLTVTDITQLRTLTVPKTTRKQNGKGKAKVEEGEEEKEEEEKEEEKVEGGKVEEKVDPGYKTPLVVSLPEHVFELPWEICQVRRDIETKIPQGFGARLKGLFKKEPKDEHLKAFIQKRDLVLVIDNGTSMQKFWPIVTFVAITLAMKIEGLDEDGYDVQFTINGAKYDKFGLKGKGGLKTLKKTLMAAQPQSLKPTDMSKVLDDLFREHRRDRYGRATTLLVLTDGAWKGTIPIDNADNKIVEFARDLVKVKAPDRHYTIGFIRFGVEFRDRLKALDDELREKHKIRNIVDQASWKSNVNKMILGSLCPAEDANNEDKEELEGRNALGSPTSALCPEKVSELFKKFNGSQLAPSPSRFGHSRSGSTLSFSLPRTASVMSNS